MGAADTTSHTPARGALAHLPPLDGLRGIAVLSVMLHHFALDPAVNSRMALRLVRVFRFGWCGVELFFVLSGFLITRILLASRGREGYYANFYKKRVLRIFPLYYATLIAVLYLVPLFGDGVSAEPISRHQAWLWLYLTNVGSVIEGTAAFTNTYADLNHFWSLAIEEQFYLVWPAVVALVAPRSLLKAACGGVVAGALLRAWLVRAEQSSQMLYVLTPCRLDGLLLGAAIAVAATDEGLRRPLRDAAPVALAIGGLGVALTLLRAGPGFWTPSMMVEGYGLIALMFAGVVALVVTRPEGALARALSNRALMTLGTYSYGLYVLHRAGAVRWIVPLEPVMFGRVVLGADAPTERAETAGLVAFMLLSSAVSMVLAVISYHALERPFLKMKDALDRPPPPRDEASAPAATGGRSRGRRRAAKAPARRGE